MIVAGVVLLLVLCAGPIVHKWRQQRPHETLNGVEVRYEGTYLSNYKLSKRLPHLEELTHVIKDTLHDLKSPNATVRLTFSDVPPLGTTKRSLSIFDRTWFLGRRKYLVHVQGYNPDLVIHEVGNRVSAHLLYRHWNPHDRVEFLKIAASMVVRFRLEKGR